MNMDYRKLGTRVRQSRFSRGMTQEQLAERTGVSGSFIGHIERGEKKASMETVVAICNAMAVAPAALLQDSLSNEVMQSEMNFHKENESLVNDLMQVLREHERKGCC
ncbi:MAG: helix-turn-helix transcriptional regulator [Clostridia bacterium]|nr:helix-turn-helix transcriptional regulator [Clostridia bacterium]